MRRLAGPWLAWLGLGVMVGFAAAKLLPPVELQAPAAAPPFGGLLARQPVSDMPSPVPTESPTPTPEPYVPCKDSLFQVPPPPPGPDGEEANYLHTCSSQLFDSKGRPAQITGVNWYGIEEWQHAPGGLAARNWRSIVEQIASMGFNTIRLPFSNDSLRPGIQPYGINYELNPDLVGLTPLEIMDRIVGGARENRLKIVLDRHRPHSRGQSSFWYTAEVTEEQWIADWQMLARRYLGNDTVIGVDLHNEPAEKTTWGTFDPATDWRMAVEKAGNAIHQENPYLLIFVEGIYQYDDLFWWGGNLKGVQYFPISLNIPGRLVYAPHDFGPGVYPQPWFMAPSFPANMEGIWDEHWGFIHIEGRAPVVVGEFGTHSTGEDKEGVYQRTFLDYLKKNQIGYLYWALNPDSPDSGGLLDRDWVTPLADKLALVSTYQAPLIGSP